MSARRPRAAGSRGVSRMHRLLWSGACALLLSVGLIGAPADALPPGRGSTDPVVTGSPAPYTSRIVVNRPVDARDFNGTVIVEWLNVSGGADASPDWMQAHVELIRRGYVWVGVSAQSVGVNGLKG